MAANSDSRRFPPLNEQAPINLRFGIEIPLGLSEHMPQQKMTPSPVAPDGDHDNFLGLSKWKRWINGPQSQPS